MLNNKTENKQKVHKFLHSHFSHKTHNYHKKITKWYMVTIKMKKLRKISRIIYEE